MTHDEYIQLLPEGQRQFATEFIQELSLIRDVSIYHTNANEGDLRVRMGDSGRVLFTMYWQTKNKVYFCRSFVETQYLDQQAGLFEISLEPDYEPQVSSFKFKPNYINTMTVLIQLVKETIKRYQFFLQNKAKK